MSRPTGIDVVALSKQYDTPGGSVRALDAVTFHVAPGTSLAIIGASGSGKSTLLGLIAGLESPTSGHVTIGDAEVSAMPERDRAQLRRERLGLVFQADNLHPFLTAQENVELQMALNAPATSERRSLELLDRLGLCDHAHKLPDQLSGGQRQRVAVARALVHGPPVILADEPTGSLDPENGEVIVELLIGVQREAGTTLVVVTHDDGIAARLDHVLRLRDGRLKDVA